MVNTFTQIYIQIVFAVQGRQNLIKNEYKEELHKYVTGIIRNKNQKLIAINCMPYHLHVFIGMKPSISLSDLVRDIKSNSSTFINEKRWIWGKFNWQKGFGAFSYGHSQMDNVVKYIKGVEYFKFALVIYLYLIHQYICDIFIIKCFIPLPEKPEETSCKENFLRRIPVGKRRIP